MKIAMIGYGKMGKAIENIATDRGHEMILKITSSNSNELTPENLSNCDVAIEFSTPAAAVGNIMACFDAGIPVVSGTTGWNKRFKEVTEHCNKKNGTLLYASNFSIGVNIFFEVNKLLASFMNSQEGYSVFVEETHHTQKKDAPSGTAITIAEQIIQAITRYQSWVNGKDGTGGELEIRSKRIDPAPGTHKVMYTSPVDDIEIIHTAHNRTGFAAGAVLAAEFILGKHGIFGMKEVLLGLK